MLNWNKKDIWTIRAKNFLIEVSRLDGIEDRDIGKNRWAVYVYCYPNHPLFSEFKEIGMFQNTNMNLPLHCGPSFFKSHYDSSGNITSYQVGADYNHLYDQDYTYMNDEEDAISVFKDAEVLFNYMQTYIGE